MSARFFRALARRAARRYPRRERFARNFAYFKLTRDPVFHHLLESGLLGERARILDLGCGQGMVEVLLAAARESAAQWPRGWPPPPRPRALRGIDLNARDVALASAACDGYASFVDADIRTAPLEPADAIVMLDVLHYIDRASQDAVLERAWSALPPGGLLLLRVADGVPSLRFRITVALDRLSLRLRGGRPAPYHCRPLSDWKRRLDEIGFRVEPRPMSEGTPFANVLLVARKPPEGIPR
ncbi:MAG TPA: class I SAM-dependent methyltransferase [Usitatibacter sp.]|nr:class I SAM-dependent methyltransferase [Usitatibacter sp.]